MRRAHKATVAAGLLVASWKLLKPGGPSSQHTLKALILETSIKQLLRRYDDPDRGFSPDDVENLRRQLGELKDLLPKLSGHSQATAKRLVAQYLDHPFVARLGIEVAEAESDEQEETG